MEPAEFLIRCTLEKLYGEADDIVDCILGSLLVLLLVNNLLNEAVIRLVKSKETKSDRNRMLIKNLIDTVKTEEAFKVLCAVFASVPPCYEELADDIKVVYSILKLEGFIVEHLNMDDVYQKLDLDRGDFLTDREKVRLRKSPNKSADFMDIMKDKECRHFKELWRYLESIPTVGDCITKEINSLSTVHIDSANMFAGSVELLSYWKRVQHYYSNRKPVQDGIYMDLELAKLLDTENTSPTPEHEFVPTFCTLSNIVYEKRKWLRSRSEVYECPSKTCILFGAPGCGKTTLVNKICQDWIDGKMSKCFDLVLLFSLRNKVVANCTSLQELLQFYGEKDLAEHVDKHLRKTLGKDVLILLDGWDELHPDKQGLFRSMIASDFPQLSKATLIITSRPIGNQSLPSIDRKIEVVGFCIETSKSYIKNYLQNNALLSKFWKQLDSFETLQAMIYVPVNLRILLKIFECDDQSLPSTLTMVYEKYVLHCLKRHREEKERADSSNMTSLKCLGKMEQLFLSLCKMAYYGTRKNKLDFTEDEVCKYCFAGSDIPHGFDGMGLFQAEIDGNTYQFVHKTVQEFLAAWYITQHDLAFQKKKISLDNSAIEMLLIFYSGLMTYEGRKDECELVLLHSISKKAVPNAITKTQYEIARRPIWWDVWFRHCTEFIRSYASSELYAKTMSEKISYHLQCVLMTCAMEAQNPKLCQIICNSKLFRGDCCWITIPQSCVTPHLLEGVSYCIANGGKKWVVHCLTLSSVGAKCLAKYITDDGVNANLQVLETTCKPENVDAVINLIHPQTFLQWLIVSRSTELDDDGMVRLTRALHDNQCIKQINLLSCRLNTAKVTAIAELLKVNTTLEAVMMPRNDNLAEEDVLMLFEAVCQYNDRLFLLGIDDSPHKVSPKVMALVEKINKTRAQKRLHSLLLSFGECGRLITRALHSVVRWLTKS